MKSIFFQYVLLFVLGCISCLQASAQRFDDDAAFPSEGKFYEIHSLQMGMEHGNPRYNNDKWFRVNSPQVSLMKDIKDRYETRYNGLMMIWAEADVTAINGAELYCEVWGGHPGTYNKRVSVNGRSTYLLPEVGSAENNCTHSYPAIVLKPSDLVNGYNAFQFACDKDDEWGWGHFILHDAQLRLDVPRDYPSVKDAQLEEFEATVKVHRVKQTREQISLALDASDENLAKIKSVDYQAFYQGYDENGNGLTRDWHGMTHQHEDVHFAATSSES
ncbi:hypothetical protein K8I31_14530, partial [bacterium]|nr:hypothetical protein [bacterium]